MTLVFCIKKSCYFLQKKRLYINVSHILFTKETTAYQCKPYFIYNYPDICIVFEDKKTKDLETNIRVPQSMGIHVLTLLSEVWVISK